MQILTTWKIDDEIKSWRNGVREMMTDRQRKATQNEKRFIF
jgi:hypothetical protein